MQAKFEELSGKSPNWNDSEEFVAIMMAVVNAELQTEAETQQAVWDAYSPNNATGRANENIAALALLERIPASASRAVVSLSGTPGVIVPAGKIVRHATTKTRWTLLEDVTLPDAGIFECSETGPVPAGVGTLTSIVTPVSGWSSSTNTAATLGRVAETDAELRARRVRALGQASTGTIASISSAVLAVDGITGVLVVDNRTDFDVTVGAFTVAPTKILVMVLPDPLVTDEKTALAEALVSTVAAGTRTVGDETCETSVDGVTYSFNFAYADVRSVDVDVTLSLSSGYELEDVEQAVRDALADYFSLLQIGGNVLLLPVYGKIADIPGITEVVLEFDGSPTNLSLAASEIAQLGTVTVA
jgi:uncharacterized phage protein gp47/JayE